MEWDANAKTMESIMDDELAAGPSAWTEIPELNPLKKRKRAADWVVSMATREMEDVAHLPVADEDTEVYCLSQVVRKLSDPDVGERDCVVAEQVGGSRPWKGSLLSDFMEKVTLELEEMKKLGEEMKMVTTYPTVVFEAYKILEGDFSMRMHSFLGMRKYQKFVGQFGTAIAAAAKAMDYSCSTQWMDQKIPFGIFVHATVLMLDAVFQTEKGRLRGEALLSKAEKLFHKIVKEVLEELEEDYTALTALSPLFQEAMTFMVKRANTEAVIREFAACASLRHARNENSYPFSPIASKAMRETARNLYSSLLANDFTKDFRHVAVIGQIKLEFLEFSKKQKMILDTAKGGEQLLNLAHEPDSPSSDDSSSSSD